MTESAQHVWTFACCVRGSTQPRARIPKEHQVHVLQNNMCQIALCYLRTKSDLECCANNAAQMCGPAGSAVNKKLMSSQKGLLESAGAVMRVREPSVSAAAWGARDISNMCVNMLSLYAATPGCRRESRKKKKLKKTRPLQLRLNAMCSIFAE